MEEPIRAWIYRAFLTVLVVLAVFNIVQLTQDQQDALMDLVQVLVLGFPVGLAVKNTSTQSRGSQPGG